VVEANLRHNNPDLRIFEIGKVFLARPSREGLKLGGVMTGSAWPDDWAERPRIIDFFDLKGVVEQLFDSLGLENLKFLAPGPDFLFPGVQIYLGDEDLGWLGKVRKEILASFEILGPVYGFEFGLDRLLAALRPTLVYRPIPKFPAVVRDLSFLLDDKVEAGQVAGLIRSLAGPMLERLQFFDCFRGEQLGPEKKSLGLRLTFRANDRTLNRAEVDSLIQQISDGLKDRLGARLRGPQG
jgi:phenylalanyl-tRNA synthetase beta chain